MIHYKVVNHMDIEIVKKSIYIYKVPQITVQNSISQWLTYLYKGLFIEEYHCSQYKWLKFNTL